MITPAEQLRQFGNQAQAAAAAAVGNRINPPNNENARTAAADVARGALGTQPNKENAKIAAAKVVRTFLYGTSMLSGFMGQINGAGGFARQNRYEVLIPFSTLKGRSTQLYKANNSVLEYADVEATDWVEDYYGADPKKQDYRLTAFCEKSELPSYQFQLETNRHYGPSFKIPHTPEYQDITMTFLCGNDMYERYAFETWMYLIMDPETNNFNYIDEYALDINIKQYSETNQWNYWTTLVDAYPVAINTQDLAYDQNNTHQKIQVTFTYKYAIPFDGKGADGGRQLRGNRLNFGQEGAGGTPAVIPPPPTPPNIKR